MRTNRRVASAALLGGLLLLGCASKPPPGPPLAGPDALAEEYRIGIDDRISVHVWRNPELSIEVPVRYDGRISLPLVGEIRVGGLTPEEVSREVQNRLAAFVREPNVTVIVTDMRSHEFISRIRVTGAVEQPTSLPYRKGMTVLDAVLAAGGTTEYAAMNRTQLHRRTTTGTVSLKVRLADIFEEGSLGTNYPLLPGDIVTVPQRLF